MVDVAYQQGYFSVLRWRPNPTRDEARNVAVMLFDAEGTMGGLRKVDVGPDAVLSVHLLALLDLGVDGLQDSGGVRDGHRNGSGVWLDEFEIGRCLHGVDDIDLGTVDCRTVGESLHAHGLP